MGSAYSTTHYRTAELSAEERAALYYYNDRIGAYFWAGIGGTIALFTLARLVADALSWRRRRKASQAVWTKQPPQYEIDNHAGEVSLGHLPAAIVATFRKISVNQPRIIEKLYMGSIGHVLLIAGYISLNFGLVFGAATNDIDWFAHHAAMLCFANLPLIIGLAGKNNLISLVTGVPYESLNGLHRWTARMIVILSSIHIGGRIYVNVPSSEPSGSGYGYIRWGWTGWTAFLLLIFGATRVLRNMNYQLFKASHIVLVLVAIVSMFAHRPERYGWILAGLLLWSLDRIWRTGRVVYHHLVKTVKDRPGHPRAWVEALSEDTIRLTVTTTQHWVPGQHAMITAPSLAVGGHPFSIASNARPLEQTHDGHPYAAEQIFIVRVRKGFTRRLYEHAIGKRDALKKPKRSDSMPPSTEKALKRERTKTEGELEQGRVDAIVSKYPWAAIHAWSEGAYGHFKRYGEEYQTLLLITGGSGVAYALPIMRDIVRRARAMQLGQAESAVVTQRVVFVWVVRDPAHLEWIEDDLHDAIAHAPPGLLHLRIHCSRIERIPKERLYDAKVDGENPLGPARFVIGDEASRANMPREAERIKFRAGRPRVDEIIEEEIQATAPMDWVSVGVCGPSSLGQAVMEATSKAIQPMKVLRGERRRNVKLELEEFGW